MKLTPNKVPQDISAVPVEDVTVGAWQPPGSPPGSPPTGVVIVIRQPKAKNLAVLLSSPEDCDWWCAVMADLRARVWPGAPRRVS